MTIVAQTPAEISIFQALAIKGALKLYVNTGMQVNRAYTPKNMIMMVERITGKKFKRGQNRQALEALEAWINEKKGA